jgi:hypothetical protein
MRKQLLLLCYLLIVSYLGIYVIDTIISHNTALLGGNYYLTIVTLRFYLNFVYLVSYILLIVFMLQFIWRGTFMEFIKNQQTLLLLIGTNYVTMLIGALAIFTFAFFWLPMLFPFLPYKLVLPIVMAAVGSVLLVSRYQVFNKQLHP